jgi:TM2 domain-containing membrane protein YozV
MNCANHPEIPASAYCRECGKPMCQECQRPALGSIYCGEHLPVTAAPPPPPAPPRAAPDPGAYAGSPYSGSPSYTAPAASPYTAPPASPYTAPAPPQYESHAHPGLALILGFIPGVGAIYNGQYAKGLIHAVVFGLLVSIVSSMHGSLEPLFALLIAAWVFYMAFEAYHTARKRRYGVAVEEFSSLFDVRPTQGRFPAGAILLIGLGFLLLLDTTDIISMEQLERYWPVGLILFGLYLLYARLSPVGKPDRNAELPK